ncbi:tRNA (adenosine(37)-N6)-threonylcarbamoyltransferase complex dimerization subunit type 1 TsaB [Desulfovibrio sp. OttesenSCG-928-M14]|nr:tRNA (adenosine(37)-N6)-threonylcarbamoyltransferase complex dimerization subunit type 1 TsaB [Desulfovibrio sp. OttesenSCG-928-M14]
MNKHLLVINAAEGLLQLLFARREIEGGPWLAQHFDQRPAASQGAELLTPRIRDGLETLRLQPRDIGYIASVRGPGSFTGLRLALATASGLGRAVGALRAGLDYLPLLALGAAQVAFAGDKAAQSPQSFWAVTHARRDLVHVQGFTATEVTDLTPLTAILVLPPQEALNLMLLTVAHACGPVAALCGSGLVRNRDLFAAGVGLFEKQGLTLRLLGSECEHPGSPALLQASAKAHFCLQDPEPLYVRPSDAEANIERIAESLGLDPADARARLEQLV